MRGRESQIQTGRQILTKDSRHGPGGEVRLAVVGRDKGHYVDRRVGLLDGERPVPRRIVVVGIRADKQPRHEVDTCVRDGFIGERSAEGLPSDAIADDDTALPIPAVNHGRRALSRDLGQIDRAKHVRGDEKIVVGEGSAERQACHGHGLV